MSLTEFRLFLVQHGINLTLTPEGKIKPTAGRPPTPEVVAQLKVGVAAHRAQLLAELAAPVASVQTPEHAAGHCGTCQHWVALDGWGYKMGKCHAQGRYFVPGDGAGLAISAAHKCASVDGLAWRAAAPHPTA